MSLTPRQGFSNEVVISSNGQVYFQLFWKAQSNDVMLMGESDKNHGQHILLCVYLIYASSALMSLVLDLTAGDTAVKASFDSPRI